MNRLRLIKYLNYFSLAIGILALGSGIYIAINGLGLIDGLSFGPGSYYYTDIPNWPQIFLGEHTFNLGFKYPFLAVLFFLGWGLICFKGWQWLDSHLK